MANKIIDELIEEQIDIFRSAFAQRAKVLFHDDEKRTNLGIPENLVHTERESPEISFNPFYRNDWLLTQDLL